MGATKPCGCLEVEAHRRYSGTAAALLRIARVAGEDAVGRVRADRARRPSALVLDMVARSGKLVQNLAKLSCVTPHPKGSTVYSKKLERVVVVSHRIASAQDRR